MRLRGTLDFVRYGSTAPADFAVAAGYFQAQGLEVQFDASRGSQEAIVRIATGSYDVGTADLPTLIQFAAQNPNAPRAVMLIVDRSPMSIVTLGKSHLSRPSDLRGRILAVGETDGGSRLLPAFLRINGLSVDQIIRKTVDVRVRDTLLMRGDVDGAAANNYTALFNLKVLGLDARQINLIEYAAYGMDLYGQALIVSPRLIEKDPASVRGFVLAMAQAWQMASRDPARVLQASAQIEGTIDVTLETERLRYYVEHCIMTPRIREHGLGHMEPERLQRTIERIVGGLALSRTPQAEDIYDGRFLPGPEARRLGSP